jgi:hypothetical protein
MPAQQQITVHVKPSHIKCTPKGGHGHAAGGDRFQWISSDNAPFTLDFADMDTLKPEWPFVEPEPTWPVTETKVLTLKDLLKDPQGVKIPRYFKYTVKAAICPEDLDPIVIVDK